MALMRGDYATAVRLMAPAVQQIGAIGGGSREQKDIFLDVFLALPRRLGNVDQVVPPVRTACARSAIRP
jgi:hypothetical protein